MLRNRLQRSLVLVGMLASVSAICPSRGLLAQFRSYGIQLGESNDSYGWRGHDLADGATALQHDSVGTGHPHRRVVQPRVR
jgi:hypothetical protein